MMQNVLIYREMWHWPQNQAFDMGSHSPDWNSIENLWDELMKRAQEDPGGAGEILC